MYAVIRTGGKQYRVQEGEKLLVDRLQGEEGTRVLATDLAVVVYCRDSL